jgi:hypothetical protein
MSELSVYSSIGVRSAAEELFRKFEKKMAAGLPSRGARRRCWSRVSKQASEPTF